MGDFGDLLIDFNSPVSKADPVSRNIPLIPCPLSTNPVIENPFDIVASCVDDPFDCLSSECKDPAQENEDCSDKVCLQKENSQAGLVVCTDSLPDYEEENCLSDDVFVTEPKCPINLSKHNLPCIKPDSEVDNVMKQDQTFVSTPTELVKFQHTPSDNIDSHNISISQTIKADEKSNSSINSSTLNDDSSEASTSLDLGKNCNIAEVIAKRVNACIQKALNSTSSNPLASSSPTKDNLSKKIFPETSKIDSSVLNRSHHSSESQIKKITHPCFSTSFDTTIQNSSRMRSASMDALMCSSPVDQMYKENKKEINKEALKLCRRFKFLSTMSSEQLNADDDNIFHIGPPSEMQNISICSDVESEEEEGNDDVGLPKLKLFRRSYSEGEFNISSSSINPDVVTKFKKFRASLDNSTGANDSPEPSKDNTFVKEKTDHNKPPASDPMKCVAIKEPVMLNLKPKKKSVSVNQKGPLKAVLPLQNVMRNGIKKTSPLKALPKVSEVNKNITKDSSFNGSLIKPVAASTPQKLNSVTSGIPGRQSRREGNTGYHHRSSSVSSEAPSKHGSSLSYKSKGTEKTTSGYKEFARPQTAPSNRTTGGVLASIKNSPHTLKRPSLYGPKFRSASGKVVPDKENRILT